MQQASSIKLWTERYGGWLLVALLCAIPVVRWWGIGSVHLGSGADIFLALGRGLGLVGLMLYALNFVLMTRWKWLENLFGGLNKVYIAHHITGGLALIFVLFHPLLLALNLVDIKVVATFHDAMTFLLPRGVHLEGYLTTFRQDSAINNGLLAYIGMVLLLIITFFVKLPYQLWLFTHKFLGVAFLLAGLHIFLVSSDVSRDHFLKYYLLTWVIIGLLCYIYRTLMGNVFVRRATYTLENTEQQPGGVIALQLSPDTKPIAFKPGQFVFIRFINVKGLKAESHPFSITSSPDNQHLWLSIKALGDFTNKLARIPKGAKAEVEGAFGRFSYTRFNKPQIWIAGGIGITPFLSMAQTLDTKTPPIDLVYSAATRSELIEQHALGTVIPQQVSNFRYQAYVTDEMSGFLTADWIIEHCGGVEGKEIFICGPPGMMRALRQQLRAKGVHKYNIHTEEFDLQ